MKKKTMGSQKMRFGEDDIWLLQQREKLPGPLPKPKFVRLGSYFPAFPAAENEKSQTNGRIIRPKKGI